MIQDSKGTWNEPENKQKSKQLEMGRKLGTINNQT